MEIKGYKRQIAAINKSRYVGGPSEAVEIDGDWYGVGETTIDNNGNRQTWIVGKSDEQVAWIDPEAQRWVEYDEEGNAI